ncbi:outer membrane lipoprotein-sorting protein [Mariprofundus erugo]|uniref:outer membrane lipoprotein-sorting protein n=1 Tax=Mariprofundus erugo TaxID=2528639 RepID=UPI0010FE5A45|nr:outer membrane lipoprotein-sorting protein [Mariprofundus erugo]TLS73955.1 outer membrane lipoprotein-sorting protein [Mariprofundus erugo]
MSMRLFIAHVVIVLVLVGHAGGACAGGQFSDADARALVEKVQQLLRSDTSMARYTMRIETPEWQREMRMDTWDDRVHKRFFIRILSPAKDRDTTWLKDGANLWMYLPRLERDIRIPPSMMLSNWMGSDFTNDDLVKMESVVDDYNHHLIARDERAYTIESIPRPDAPVVWGKIVHRISLDGMPLSDDYFDEHGVHIRRLLFDQVREMGGRKIPSRWTMQPLDEAGELQGKQTVMIVESVSFDVRLDDAVFSRANLRRSAR